MKKKDRKKLRESMFSPFPFRHLNAPRGCRQKFPVPALTGRMLMRFGKKFSKNWLNWKKRGKKPLWNESKKNWGIFSSPWSIGLALRESPPKKHCGKPIVALPTVSGRWSWDCNAEDAHWKKKLW